MRVIRSAARFRTEQPGIVSFHCFSAGPHYDPANLSFGPLLGWDEHLIAPGAGFAEHAHRGVEILSRVVAGQLSHAGAAGARLVGPGETFSQSAGDGIRHTERNVSETDPLRLVQVTLAAGASHELRLVSSEDTLAADLIHAFVVSGSFDVTPEIHLQPGDSLRAHQQLSVAGAGEMLVLLV